MKANSKWCVLGAVIMLFGASWALVDIRQISAQEQREPITVTELPDSPDDPPATIHMAQYAESYPGFALTVAIPSEGNACLHTSEDTDCFPAVNLHSLHITYAYNIDGIDYIQVLIRRDIAFQTEGIRQVLSSLLGDGARSQMALDMIISLLADDVSDSVGTVIQAQDRRCLIALNTEEIENCWQ
jgi:hypothetical protein